MGGEEHHEQQERAARIEGEAHGASQASPDRPPGSFPRSVSPTVDEHPDQRMPDDTHREEHAETDEPTSSTRNAADHPTQPETTPGASSASADAADTSAARFISSLFHQRSGSPLGGNGAHSPGPMGTALHLGRTASSQSVNRTSPTPPAVPEKETTRSLTDGPSITGGEASLQSGNDSSTRNPNSQSSSGPPIENTTTSGSRNESTIHDDAEQPHHPHPVYPTVIPTEHLERHARREAMLREAERERERTSDGSGASGAGHPLSE